MIIPCFWIFSAILEIPEFLNDQFDKKIDPKFCIRVWPDHQKWILKALFYVSFVIGIVSFMLMVGLYSGVVYTLWFKSDDDNELTYRQKVCNLNPQFHIAYFI